MTYEIEVDVFGWWSRVSGPEDAPGTYVFATAAEAFDVSSKLPGFCRVVRVTKRGKRTPVNYDRRNKRRKTAAVMTPKGSEHEPEITS